MHDLALFAVSEGLDGAFGIEKSRHSHAVEVCEQLTGVVGYVALDEDLAACRNHRVVVRVAYGLRFYAVNFVDYHVVGRTWETHCRVAHDHKAEFVGLAATILKVEVFAIFVDVAHAFAQAVGIALEHDARDVAVEKTVVGYKHLTSCADEADGACCGVEKHQLCSRNLVVIPASEFASGGEHEWQTSVGHVDNVGVGEQTLVGPTDRVAVTDIVEVKHPFVKHFQHSLSRQRIAFART